MSGRFIRGLANRAGVVSVLMILAIAAGGRLLGFFREVLISSQYGTSPPADAFFTVQQIPTIVSTFVFGPFMIAFVPYYAAMQAAGNERQAIAGTARGAVRVGLAITAMMVAVAAGFLLTRDESSDGSRWLIGSFTLILAVSVVPLLVTGLASVVLNARGQHAAAMVIAALTPAGMLAGLVLLTLVPIAGHDGALPWSFVAGSAISAGVGLVALRRIGRSRRPAPVAAAVASDPAAAGPGSTPGDPVSTAGPRRAFRRELMASAAENVGFSLNQALTVWFAAGLGGGLVAIFSYGLRISSFAFSLVSPVGIWIQTWMTRDASHREGRLLFALVAGMAAIALSIAAGLIVLGGPLVTFIYVRGSFSEADAASVASVLVPLAVYGAIVTVNQVMARYYFVLLRGAAYSRVMLVAYLGGNALKVILVGPFGLHGVIWASVLAEGCALAFFLAETVRGQRTIAPAADTVGG